MRIPKKYGESQVPKCPFCENTATAKNKQGVLVYHRHKNENIEDIKCRCGYYLELKIGKYGPYFKCMNCGNVGFEKAMNERFLNEMK